LAGNLWEWTQDFQGPTINPCDDCANLTPSSDKLVKGGSFLHSGSYLQTSGNLLSSPSIVREFLGARCARPL
jgi:formylglycine-generating enzyme